MSDVKMVRWGTLREAGGEGATSPGEAASPRTDEPRHGEAGSADDVTPAYEATAPHEVTSPSEATAGRAPLVVAPKDGYTKIPNAMLDNLLPMLGVHEQAVYLRIYRLTIGFQRDTCEVSVRTLARAARLGMTRTAAAIATLEAIGLVERLAPNLRGPNEQRAGRIRILLPEGIVAPYEVASYRDATSRRGVTTPRTRMKEAKKDSMKAAPVAAAPALLHSDPKATAAAFVAERRREGIGGDELWRIALAWAAEQGIDARLIDEAIG